MDKLHERAPRSGDFIDLQDDYQVKQWTEIFNVTSADLMDVVQAVGTSMTDVRAFIKARKKLRGL